MGNIWTHYDNLQVARSASAEVISAAYKSLSRKYHPDRNGGNPQSERTMKIINASYAALSDPAKRKAHDEWIKAKEAEAFGPNADNDVGAAGAGKGSPDAADDSRATDWPYQPDVRSGARNWGRDESNEGGFKKALLWIGAPLLLLGIVALLPPQKSGLPTYDRGIRDENEPGTDTGSAGSANDTAALINSDSTSYDSGDQSLVNSISDPDPSTGLVVPHVPDGSEWPENAGYLPSYPRERSDGYSSVTVDNSENDSPVYVKLVAIEENRTRPVRHVYIPAASKFSMRSVSPGDYDVRYMNLRDGSLARSESFNLIQRETDTGVEFQNLTLTLFRVPNGNLNLYPLRADEF